MNSTFASTGWWAWPDATGLSNPANVAALKEAAHNFEVASYANLPPLNDQVMLEKSVDKNQGASGDTLIFTLKAINMSGQNKAIILKDPLDQKLEFVSTDHAGTFDLTSYAIIWPEITLTPDQTETYTFQVKIK